MESTMTTIQELKDLLSDDELAALLGDGQDVSPMRGILRRMVWPA
jgi:hypothetical protein